MSISKVKISQLAEAETSAGSKLLVTDVYGSSKSFPVDRMKSEIHDIIFDEFSSLIVPKLEVKIANGVLYYRVNNLPPTIGEMFQDLKIGLCRWKHYRRRRGVDDYDIGRKYTLIDDNTSKYGDSEAEQSNNIITWTNVRIIPNDLPLDAFSEFMVFPYSASSVIGRFCYCKNSDGETIPLENCFDLSNELHITGINRKRTHQEVGRLNITLNVGLVCFRDLRMGGKTKRIFGEIIPLRCSCFTDLDLDDNSRYLRYGWKMQKNSFMI